jgi:hypothetical protein
VGQTMLAGETVLADAGPVKRPSFARI